MKKKKIEKKISKKLTCYSEPIGDKQNPGVFSEATQDILVFFLAQSNYVSLLLDDGKLN